MTSIQEGIRAVPASLRTFMSGIIDYAGLFPPAALPLEDAIVNYAGFRQSRDAWMLARFVAPIDRLPELSGHAHLFQEHPPFRFSVLGTGGGNEAMFLEHLEEDLEAMTDFEMRHGGRAVCDAMEVRFPASARDAESIASTVRNAVAMLAEHDRTDFALFLEVPWHDEASRLLMHVASAAAESPLVGLKIRTGGLEPNVFPDSMSMARFVNVCHDVGAPFKATAGLHHPLRRYNDSVGAHMHGFVNVFGAAVLLHAGRIEPDELVQVLEDEDATSFEFTSGAFRWRDRAVSADELAAGRRFATSFGSCSFDEPRDDLRLLNIL